VDAPSPDVGTEIQITLSIHHALLLPKPVPAVSVKNLTSHPPSPPLLNLMEKISYKQDESKYNGRFRIKMGVVKNGDLLKQVIFPAQETVITISR